MAKAPAAPWEGHQHGKAWMTRRYRDCSSEWNNDVFPDLLSCLLITPHNSLITICTSTILYLIRRSTFNWISSHQKGNPNSPAAIRTAESRPFYSDRFAMCDDSCWTHQHLHQATRMNRSIKASLVPKNLGCWQQISDFIPEFQPIQDLGNIHSKAQDVVHKGLVNASWVELLD